MRAGIGELRLDSAALGFTVTKNTVLGSAIIQVRDGGKLRQIAIHRNQAVLAG